MVKDNVEQSKKRRDLSSTRPSQQSTSDPKLNDGGFSFTKPLAVANSKETKQSNDNNEKDKDQLEDICLKEESEKENFGASNSIGAPHKHSSNNAMGWTVLKKSGKAIIGWQERFLSISTNNDGEIKWFEKDEEKGCITDKEIISYSLFSSPLEQFSIVAKFKDDNQRQILFRAKTPQARDQIINLMKKCFKTARYVEADRKCIAN